MIVSGVVVKASLKIKTFSAFSTDELIDQYLDNFPAIISGCPKTTRFLLFVCDPFLFYLFVYCFMNSVKAATHVLDKKKKIYYGQWRDPHRFQCTALQSDII